MIESIAKHDIYGQTSFKSCFETLNLWCGEQGFYSITPTQFHLCFLLWKWANASLSFERADSTATSASFSYRTHCWAKRPSAASSNGLVRTAPDVLQTIAFLNFKMQADATGEDPAKRKMSEYCCICSLFSSSSLWGCVSIARRYSI